MFVSYSWDVKHIVQNYAADKVRGEDESYDMEGGDKILNETG